MDMDLDSLEIRVLGALIEKEITTPDQYPLSLNSLVLACNQKSNREPVMNLNESEVSEVIDGLSKRYLVAEQTGFGSRVVKYKQKFCNSILNKLQLSPQQIGVICVLFLRGPQTPGELHNRSKRLCEFNDVEEVKAVLGEFKEWESNPLVTRLAREPGKRESRYAHLFSGEVETNDEHRDSAESRYRVDSRYPAESRNHVESHEHDVVSPDRESDNRLDELAQQIEQMRVEIESMKQAISRLTQDQ